MKKTASLVLIMLAINANAIQVYNVKNGAEVSAKIYTSGLSRISLQDDRIAAIKGVAGEFLIDKNEEIGDIYIKPSSARSSDTINLFISSEKGNTYSLRLTVGSDHPETISLVSNDLIFDEPESMSTGYSDRKADMIEMIKRASAGADIKGYSTEIFKEPSRLKLKNDVVSIVEKIYTGREYRVEVLRIENNLKKTVSVKEKDLVNSNEVMAVSLETNVLPDGSFTKAYRVVRL